MACLPASLSPPVPPPESAILPTRNKEKLRFKKVLDKAIKKSKKNINPAGADPCAMKPAYGQKPKAERRKENARLRTLPYELNSSQAELKELVGKASAMAAVADAETIMGCYAAAILGYEAAAEALKEAETALWLEPEHHWNLTQIVQAELEQASVSIREARMLAQAG